MEAFSEQVITNYNYNLEQESYDYSTLENNLHELMEKLFSHRGIIKFERTWFINLNERIFEIDISSVKPSLNIQEQLTNREEVFEVPKLGTHFNFEFDKHIPPKKKFKINVKIAKFKKYKPKKTDFENMF